MTDEVMPVLAVVVTYHPTRACLIPLLERLLQQCREVLIVDNTPAEDDSVFELSGGAMGQAGKVRIVRIGKNAGIAFALNLGIDVALAEDFEYVLLSDQDSLPADGMVAGLVQAAHTMEKRGKPIGAVGPLVHDLVTGMEYPFQAPVPGKLFYGHRFPTAQDPHVVSLSIITSGTLIPVRAARDLGGMIDALFIDFVDIEWCLRARARGYEIVGTGSAVLNHRLGERALRIWYLGWRVMSEYGPLRLYYRVRNFIHLLRLSHVPRCWKIRSSWYILGIIYGHLVYSRHRGNNLRAVLAGLCDGVLGRLGPCRRVL